MNIFFIEKFDYNIVFPVALAVISAVIVLVLTLNTEAALLVLLLGVAAVVIQKSYSRGWLLLLGVFILFPSLRISDNVFLLSDLLLFTLGFLGLLNLALTKISFPKNNLSYYFFLLGLLGMTMVLFGYVIGQQINKTIWYFTLNLIMIWLSFTVFQHYFQTFSRVRRFFWLIIACSLAHTVFGLIMFAGGWQLANGMGIISDKLLHPIFLNEPFRVNGFMGLHLENRLRSSALAPLLMIGIPVTYGAFLNIRRKQGGLLNIRISNEEHFNIRFWDKLKYYLEFKTLNDLWKRQWQKIKNFIKKPELWLVLGIILQSVALILTFRYFSLIFLLIGFLVFAILDRNQRLGIIISGIIIVIALIVPSLLGNFQLGQESVILNWFEGFSFVAKDWLWGNGWKVVGNDGNGFIDTIHNSYLYIWNNYGIWGILILLAVLAQYFYDLYVRYIKSEGEQRIWLMVIITIFISFSLEAMTSNALFYGPAALLFWMMYAVSINIAQARPVFGIIETKLWFEPQKGSK
jgi:hypothetical protein